jgi:hypothetical protein
MGITRATRDGGVVRLVTSEHGYSFPINVKSSPVGFQNSLICFGKYHQTLQAE